MTTIHEQILPSEAGGGCYALIGTGLFFFFLSLPSAKETHNTCYTFNRYIPLQPNLGASFASHYPLSRGIPLKQNKSERWDGLSPSAPLARHPESLLRYPFSSLPRHSWGSVKNSLAPAHQRWGRTPQIAHPPPPGSSICGRL